SPARWYEGTPMARHGHAGAVVLLGGWLLMIPPLRTGPDGKRFVDIDAPMSKWEHGAAFDAADDCEDMRMQVRSGSPVAPERAAVLEQARCVPAEHIYPPKEP